MYKYLSDKVQLNNSAQKATLKIPNGKYVIGYPPDEKKQDVELLWAVTIENNIVTKIIEPELFRMPAQWIISSGTCCMASEASPGYKYYLYVLDEETAAKLEH